jgi:hypothetical protein
MFSYLTIIFTYYRYLTFVGKWGLRYVDVGGGYGV